jgi:hypothetical protein
LPSRLKKLLHKLISVFQSEFVPGRIIQDNNILAHKLFHTIKHTRGNGGLMTLTIDMEKVYD